uniref:Ig-like domain-containing protein n=1 Tax=Paramormyrops kingsleyae TaxID=1676925 RepID=A0A3B3Q9P4_9TELE
MVEVRYSVLLTLSTATVHQLPSNIIEVLGSLAKIKMTCMVRGQSNPYMYWYRQIPGSQPDLLFLSAAKGSVSDSSVTDFTAERPDGQNFYLETKNLSIKHSAVYFCAWSIAQRLKERQAPVKNLIQFY